MTPPTWQPRAGWAALRLRARLLAAIRAFFAARGLWEVETPLLGQATVPTPQIPSLVVGTATRPRYLQPSPEFAMKRLLAAGSGSIYQIAKAFRAAERGTLHNPEFTLVEWYRLGMDHYALMEEVLALLRQLAACAQRSLPSVERCSYRSAFYQALGCDPWQATTAELAELARRHDLPVTGELDRDAWLDWLLSACVVPQWPAERLTLLYDYPASAAALARIVADETGMPAAARFEVYWGQYELANGYHELTDAAEQERRFEAERAEREHHGQAAVPLDRQLLAALHHGLPDCAGVALGLDRLLMALLDCSHIDEVLAFPWERA